MSAVLVILIGLVVVMLYLLPSIIAFNRGISLRWTVLVIDLFFGWSLIGWVISLALAVSGAPTATP